MLYVLLSLMIVPFYFFLRSRNKKDLMYGMNIFMGLLCAICFHEKTYYLAFTLLFQIALINKLTNSIIINLSPKNDETKGKNNIFVLSGVIFFSLVLIVTCIILNTPASEMNISLTFFNNDIYRLLILFLSFLLVFVTRKGTKE